MQFAGVVIPVLQRRGSNDDATSAVTTESNVFLLDHGDS
jgi:hypothetical protein